jgi:site-specific recombinase
MVFNLTVLEKILGKVSFTTDFWTDPNMSPFMAVMAVMAVTVYWIGTSQQSSSGTHHVLRLCSELIRFIFVPQHHTGEHLCKAFMYILDWLNLTKVS